MFFSFRLFNVYILWLEDENFQKGDTYIPTLPKHYDTHRLAKVMQNQQVKLWLCLLASLLYFELITFIIEW